MVDMTIKLMDNVTTLEEALEEDHFQQFYSLLRDNIIGWEFKFDALMKSDPMETIEDTANRLIKKLGFDEWEAKMAAWGQRKHYVWRFLNSNLHYLSSDEPM